MRTYFAYLGQHWPNTLRKIKWMKISIQISALKGLAQAKIIKKSVILFRVLNMTI